MYSACKPVKIFDALVVLSPIQNESLVHKSKKDEHSCKIY